MVCEVEMNGLPCWAEGAGTFHCGQHTYIMCERHLTAFGFNYAQTCTTWRPPEPGVVARERIHASG